jgi:hypothetical protein
MGQKSLPLASASKHARAFERLGWKVDRAHNHIVFTKAGNPFAPCLPDHAEVSRGLLQKQLKGAGISEEDYIEAFKQKGSKAS